MKWFVGQLLLAVALIPTQVYAATILKNDFNKSGWPAASAVCSPRSLSAQVALKSVGTVDIANTAQASGAMTLIADRVPARGNWRAELRSGLLPIHNTEANRNKLTLSFTLAASDSKPISVRIESFDAHRRRTGGLAGTIYPAAPHFLQRYALDLSTLQPTGPGHFETRSPFVQFTFAGGSAEAPRPMESQHGYQLIVDNINYSSPAYYVRPDGDDHNSGRSEAAAFATPQKAIDAAQPGDIVLLMNGTYRAGQNSVVSFVRPGQPDAWIVLKNYPGHHPLLTSTGWNIVSIVKGSSSNYSSEPPLAYLEVRGLHIRGEGDVARQKYRDAMDKPDSRTNTNGIAVDCRYSVDVFHHIRIADNLVEFCTACGIGTDADWVTVENNVCRSNSWTTIYASSGISVAGWTNFDTVPNVYKRLIRNNICCHNQTNEKWAGPNKYSDGNGIIMDVNQGCDMNVDKDAHPSTNYIGRTLVQSNLCYDNGGSGIHSVTSAHIDIVNNTVYLNSASPHLEYPEIFTYGSKDVHIWNNILVAPIANTAAGEKPEPVNLCSGDNTDVVFSHNLYYGGNIAPSMGPGDAIGDPRFVQPSRDSNIADFHLRFRSPASGKGQYSAVVPYLDLDGKPRQVPPTLGAYER